jgi:predicted permease
VHREVRGVPRLELLIDEVRGFGRDLVHAGRSLAKAPGFTVVCAVSLGIGMAAVIAIPYYSRLMTLPPRGVDADGLVELLMTPQGPLEARLGRSSSETWSYPDVRDLQAAAIGVALTPWSLGESAITIQGATGVETTRVPALFVPANYFTTIGVRLARGSGFDPSIDAPSAAPVVVLTHAFWQNRLGGDAGVVGTTVTLDRVPHTVVGVAPEHFTYHCCEPRAIQVILPLERHPRVRADATVRIRREDDWIRVHGRLLPGVSLEQAQAAVSAVMSGLAQRYPATNAFKTAAVEPYVAMGARGNEALRIATAVSLGITLMVLLVVCLNVSGMVQVRTALRERELAIRQAIGATRGRLLRYQLAEALMLAGLSGALGVAVLFAVPRVVMWGMVDQPLPRQLLDAAGLTLPIAAVTVGLAVAVSLVFGLWPALRFSRPAISALKDDSGGGRRRVGRVQRATAALQIGLATPFLVISGLMVEGMRTTATADFGFALEGLAVVPLRLDDLSRQDRAFFQRAVRANLGQADGVRSVTVADGIPLAFDSRRVRVSRPGAEFVNAHLTRVADGFFDTLGIPIRSGRAITADDRDGRDRVAVVSPALADRLFGNNEAVGRRVSVSFAGADPQDLTVVGVTADFVAWQIGDDLEQLLVPLAQHPVSRILLIARSGPDVPAAWWTAAFQRAVAEADREVTPGTLVLGNDLRRNSMAAFLTQSAVAGGGGSIALLLGGLGVYGVIGFMVATRSREIAVRMALGASRHGVIRLVLRDVLRLVLPGVAAGILPILIFRVLVRLPDGVAEPLIYVAAGAIVAGVALLAGLPAALRAASVAPMGAMRSE